MLEYILDSFLYLSRYIYAMDSYRSAIYVDF